MKRFTFFILALLFTVSPMSNLSADSVETYLRLVISDRVVPQGSVITVFVESAVELKKVELLGFKQRYKMFKVWHKEAEHLFRGFLPVSALKKPGTYKISAVVIDKNDEKLDIYSLITIEDANFKTQTIALPKQKKKLMNSESLVKESREIVAALQQIDSKVYFASHFIKPVQGRISSGFGRKRIYNTGNFASYHKGIDIVGKKGMPVKASNGGWVSLAQAMKSNGKIVLVNHGHGISTIYSHMSKILVKKGEWVKRGQIIGEVGSTGISTGPHLHFGVSVNDIRVDPLPWIQNKMMIYFNSNRHF